MSRILPDLSQASREELIAQIEAMRRASQTKLTLKVSSKGALSVYGMGRWPVTLYKTQWQRLLSESAAIEAFITSHASELADKASD